MRLSLSRHVVLYCFMKRFDPKYILGRESVRIAFHSAANAEYAESVRNVYRDLSSPFSILLSSISFLSVPCSSHK